MMYGVKARSRLTKWRKVEGTVNMIIFRLGITFGLCSCILCFSQCLLLPAFFLPLQIGLVNQSGYVVAVDN